jgi:quinolinate synthase
MSLDTATLESTRAALRAKLHGIVPEFELDLKAELAYRINRLKAERGAVILGHNYMEPALFHSVCDYTGDSLELSRVAARAEADPIVFCGVRFMAETAKILNPERTVLLPARRAGCSLAESISAEDVRGLRARYPGVPIVAYINTYADVKAEVDVCCTSGNAAQVVESLDSDQVVFLPDEYLARNVARETGKTIVFPSAAPVSADARAESAGHGLHYDIVGWTGRCEVHEKFTVEDVQAVRAQFPEVVVLAHPECSPEVVDASDFSGSTAAMTRYVREVEAPRYLLLTECSPEVVDASDFSGSTAAMTRYVREVEAPRYLLLTECSMGDNIAAEAPEKDMLRLCSVRCPHMNEITLEQVLTSLRENREQIEVPEDIRVRARRSIERMLAIG